MNAQAILQKIEDDAQRTARQTRTDAEKKAGELRAASENTVAKARESVVAQANAECEALSGRMSRMAELEIRKLLLQKKREVMDEAFEQAKRALRKTPSDVARAFLLTRAAEAASGDEMLIVGAEDDGWFDGAFLDELNAALIKAGKPGSITLSMAPTPAGTHTAKRESRADVTGLILSRAGTEVYCTFEAMLEGVRAGIEAEVANTLFNE